MILGLLKRRIGITCMLAVLITLLGVNTASAQVQVTGTVLDADDNTPLPGVNIVEVGTTRGSATDFDGRFTFIASGPNVTLAVSFVGYVTQYIDLEGRMELTIELAEDVALLEEVVVTAFGIERQQRAVGFSVSKVSGEDLVQARDPNVANSLSGKVAGVLVNNTASGPQGSSRVVIRGNSSLGSGQNNQPLYVVDGVPIDNSNLGSAGMWGGSDLGDGISGINPDDIDNISVLKGGAAAALYGTRAQNGVVLITTKKGQTGAGIGVEFNSNTVFDDLVVSTDWQDQYGQGTRGEKPADEDEALDTGLSSWGAPLDGSSVVQFDGVARPYSSVGNAQKEFYRTGLTSTNTLSLSGGFQNTSFRFSISHLENQSITPGSGMQRTNFTLRGTSNLSDRLSVDAKITYIREQVDSRSRLSDAPGNSNYGVAFLPPNVSAETLRGPCQEPDLCEGDEGFEEGRGINLEGTEFQHQGSTFTQNPYFAAHNFLDDDEENRILGFGLIRYKITDWLSAQVRAGTDQYVNKRMQLEPYGTGYRPLGQLNENTWTIQESNFDFLVAADRQFTDDISVNANFGGNILYRQFEVVNLNGTDMNIPYLNTISNFANQSASTGFNEKQINSLYGQAEFSYRDYLFLTATGRNDWSSTLPRENNSYFYPSFSGAFVFSDALQVPDWMSFGKLRASWSEVGGDTDPYQLALTYQLVGQGHLGNAIGRIAQGTIPLAGLKPSSQVEIEFGSDFRFFDNRVGFDFTYYKRTTTDQILSTTISSASGFGSAIINAGEMENKGIELLLEGTPLRSPDMRWDIGLNLSKNDNKV
ncbi:MAG: SusC/RagA family TonB-linked outer membrane protein, partial [Rhodothermales bacterium]|nr:SusC/RagA family TonB-linked outer membrane protein [Rhodothermales bacterium]